MGLKKVLVVDGGFATQLSQHVGEPVDGDPLWSARFNYTKPKAILDTHYDFLQGRCCTCGKGGSICIWGTEYSYLWKFPLKTSAQQREINKCLAFAFQLVPM